MPKIVITHPVADVDNWLRFKAERSEAVAGFGGTNAVDHVARDGSNMTALSFDVGVDDLDAAMAAIVTPPPELVAAMEKHGVLPPMVTYVEG